MPLPLVLAGPVVRRVDATSVTVWIALAESEPVQVRLWAGDQLAAAGGAAVGSGDPAVGTSPTVTPRRYGEHLHIAAVTVTLGTDGAAGLVGPGLVVAYDVSVGGRGLLDLGLLADADGAGDGIDAVAPPRLALGYLPGRLPTFVTAPATLPDLRIAHSSCRKPHGSGPDALAWLDDEIAANRLEAVRRPQQLFLTGDQIYADDVAGVLLPMIGALSNELLGYDETVPMRGGAAGAGSARVATKDLPALRRGRLVAEVAKLSTTDGASHLLGFGEFAAMYLLAWSPRVWRPLPEPASLFVAANDLAGRHLTDFESAHGSVSAWREATEAGVVEARDSVLAFRAALPRVARLLANCATYMVFDDHEITDDWYLSAPWRTRVLTSALGRALLRNGLMAYCAFQATGNDPKVWAEAPAGQPVPAGHTTLGRIVTLLADGAAPTVAHENDVDTSLGLVSPTSSPEVAFHYVVPGPRHRVNVLDTRTRRTYASVTRDAPPRLVGDSLDAMLPAGPLTDGRELQVVVSAAPVLFPRLFDALVQPAAASVFDLTTHVVRTQAFDPARPRPQNLLGSEHWDLEGWGCDEGAFHALLRRLATYPRVVVLSGDVHFASSLLCDVWLKSGATNDDACDARILQCTSSAAKNQPSASQRAILRGQRSAQRLLQGRAFERLGWDGDHGVTVPHGAHLSPARRGRLLRKPTFVPADGWPGGTTSAGDKPPDVRYRVSVLRDERPGAELGVGAPVPPSLPAWNPGDPIASYAAVTAAHQQLLTGGTDPIRLMVFTSNVGVIRFAPTSTGEVAATHAVFSPVGDGTTGDDFTAHTVDLARTAAAAPPVLTTGG